VYSVRPLQIFFYIYGLLHSSVLNTLSFVYRSAHFSFPFSAVCWGLYQEIYSGDGMRDCSHLDLAGTRSLLHLVIPVLGRKCLANYKKV
jgi:hypothetical protein